MIFVLSQDVYLQVYFSKDFIHAVEEKQIAEQSAKTAKNLTEKIKEEALQIRTRADAESYAFHVKKEAVNDNLIKLKQIEAQLSAIEKWDGVLPRMTGKAIPMVSLMVIGTSQILNSTVLKKG